MDVKKIDSYISDMNQLLKFKTEHDICFNDLKEIMAECGVGCFLDDTPLSEVNGDLNKVIENINVFPDYLTAYDELYTDKQDKKLITELYEQNKDHYNWNNETFKKMVCGELNDEDYLTCYYEYVREQMRIDYNCFETDNGLWLILGVNNRC